MHHIVEGFLVRHIVDDDTMGSAVVAAGDRAEALLAGGVPDLKLTRLAVQVKRTDLKFTAMVLS